jgi:hypothetical protein
MRVVGVILSFSLATAGCAAKDPGMTNPGVICTAIAVSSLNVTVRDTSTGQPVCDAGVIAIQDGTTYTLRQTGDCRYAGPEERAGFFEVRASRPGYGTATVSNVRVGRDECHVIPVMLTVDLPPAS